MIDPEQLISNNPLEGAEIIDMVGVNPDNLAIPTNWNKMQNIIKFFNNVEDKHMVIRSVIGNKPNENRLNILWEYVQLRKELQDREGK